MAIAGSIRLAVDINETGTGDLYTPMARHLIEIAKSLTSGTGTDQGDLIWSDTRSVASGTPDDLDIVGGLTGAFGNALSMVKPIFILIRNNSTTTGQYLSVGADGAAAFVSGYMGGTTPTRTVQPGGFDCWYSPIDAGAATGGSTDVLQIASASGTISYSIVIIARSA